MNPALEVDRVSKTFTRTRALREVSLSIEQGEVHALLGQNGSGKSTLIKILSGYHAPDPGGTVRIGGSTLPFESPVGAYRLGCRFVQQDLGLVGTMSVLDNLSMGSGFPTRLGTIRSRVAQRRAIEDLGRLNLDLDPHAPISALSASERTGVAIARALRPDPDYPARLVVLDEPTATLPVDEVDQLLARVRNVSAQGVGVLYVTHHLGEVFAIANRVSVFRDGMVVGAGPVSDFQHETIVSLLAGDDLLAEEAETRSRRRSRVIKRGAAPVLDVRELCAGAAAGVSFSVHAGEVVGLAGLNGSGRDSILGAIFGGTDRRSGTVLVNGQALVGGRPDLAIGRGVAYVAPDRKIGGAVMGMSARENLTLAGLRPFMRGIGISRAKEARETKRWFERLSVRPADGIDQPIGTFSGGNQQKVLFGKWLSQEPSLFLLDEPTQGVDVGAKAELHRELEAIAEQGTAVAISSSDLDELADLCDRVLVIVDGAVSAELTGAEVTKPSITRRFMPVAGLDAAIGGSDAV